jgi:hypothetical protein
MIGLAPDAAIAVTSWGERGGTGDCMSAHIVIIPIADLAVLGVDEHPVEPPAIQHRLDERRAGETGRELHPVRSEELHSRQPEPDAFLLGLEGVLELQGVLHRMRG